MNDFLQSLRNGNIKRQDRHRKHYDKPQYRNSDRNGNRDKRNASPRKSFHGADMGDIKKLLQQLNDNVELSRIAQERTAEAMERIAVSLQALAPGSEERTAPSATGDQPSVAASTPSAGSPDVPGEPAPAEKNAPPEPASIIESLRNEGCTFEDIAAQLNEREIPTMSGRGKWRAQNVSRVFNAACAATP